MSNPAMVFPLTSVYSELFTSTQRGSYNPDDDAPGDVSSQNGAARSLELKAMTFYPTDRSDPTFSFWDYTPACLEDTTTDMFGRRGFRTPSRSAMPDESFACVPARPRRPREDELTHTADTSRADLAAALGLCFRNPNTQGLLGSFLWYRPGLCQCRFRDELYTPV
jgi:hypothetical protein